MGGFGPRGDAANGIYRYIYIDTYQQWSRGFWDQLRPSAALAVVNTEGPAHMRVPLLQKQRRGSYALQGGVGCL